MAALRGCAAAFFGALLCIGLWPALVPPAGAVDSQGGAVHLGVATCSGSNCHGASERPPGSSVSGNEYIIWSKRDKHHQAYSVLLGERAIRMARAIGLPDAANQKICLDCHADNVPQDQRGRQFQLSDGVGCEACHGGASTWLGTHISGAGHRDNLAAGMYPTEQPVARAEKCLGCHFGDATRFVDHRLIGAGHPRLAFELDTFTAIEPAHFVVDSRYVERKGRITDMQVWGAGQAMALTARMNALVDPRRARHGLFPELVLFDCQGCHHPYDSLHAPQPTASGLGPGTVKLNDANAVMLEVAASRAAPAAAKTLNAHMLALHRATDADPAAVRREAEAVRTAAGSLIRPLASHDFSSADIHAMVDAVIALGNGPDGWRFSHAEQTTMALEAMATALQSAGAITADRMPAVRKVLDGLYASFANESTFRSDVFAAGLRDFQRTIKP
ncbi:MAG TPA: multiheme c-type cytochrome [Stellaceae bacterium]|jgi:hypothetical protein|nr:multiheme c-type cytochrome [Stellaceae bacterium]